MRNVYQDVKKNSNLVQYNPHNKKSGLEGKSKVKKLFLKKSSNSDEIVCTTQILYQNQLQNVSLKNLAYLGISKQLKQARLAVTSKREGKHNKESYACLVAFSNERICYYLPFHSVEHRI